MIKGLYPDFMQWSDGGSIYLYSDPHFGDADSYRQRSLLSNSLTGEMLKNKLDLLDKMQIDNINKIVRKSDTLIILGDIGDIEKVRELKAGRKIALLGNHDKGKTNYEAPGLFDNVYAGVLTIAENIMLSHEPVDFRFCFNIHGHDHNGTEFKRYVLRDYDADMPMADMRKNYLATIKKYGLTKLNLCAEWIGYLPINLKDVIQAGVLSRIPSVHQDYIDKHNGRK